MYLLSIAHPTKPGHGEVKQFDSLEELIKFLKEVFDAQIEEIKTNLDPNSSATDPVLGIELPVIGVLTPRYFECMEHQKKLSEN